MTQSIVSDETWQRHQRIVGLRNLVEKSFLALGCDLLWMKATKAYKQLGHPTLESYLADPDVDIGRRSAYMAMGCYETFVKQLHIDQPLLLTAGVSKLEKVRPYVDATNVADLVNMAATLSRSDLEIELGEMFGAEPKRPPDANDNVRVECPNCGQRFDIEGYVVDEKENAL